MFSPTFFSLPDDPNQDKSNFEGESSHAASLRSSHSSMDEDEEHKLIMARIEALEAAEEAAGRTSDEEDMSDEENISNDDELDAAEAITKSKSYLSKDQKATLLEKLNRSEAEDYDGEDSDEEDSMLGGSGSEEEYDIEEEDEESRAHNRFSSNQGAESIRTGQGKGVIEMPAEVSKKTRPLSRFAREFADSVKARTDSEHAQQPLVSQSRDTPAKKVSFAADKDTSCSGLEIPDMQGQNELQKVRFQHYSCNLDHGSNVVNCMKMAGNVSDITFFGPRPVIDALDTSNKSAQKLFVLCCEPAKGLEDARVEQARCVYEAC